MYESNKPKRAASTQQRPASNLTYRDLMCWQKAMDLAELTYKYSARWPASEQHALTNQVRRAAVSVASNIAEGQSRGPAEFRHFLQIARGSVQEIETQLLLAHRLTYLPTPALEGLLGMTDEVSRLITGLSKSIRT